MKNIINQINKIKIENDFSKNQLYLVELINKESGFLLGKGKLYFVIKSKKNKIESINTSYLSLKTKIYINTIENSPSFEPNDYDILMYNTDNDETYLEPFIDLCTMYINSQTKIEFIDFFYSLLKLFEPNKESSFTNLIGMFGELYFIKMIWSKYNCSLADNWHNSLGSNDKYDFSFDHFNFEIKTSLKKDMIFSIKHSQIFNKKKNYISIINIDNDNSGFSTKDLYDYFKNNKPFSNNIDFMIKLEKEKRKVISKETSDLVRYTLESVVASGTGRNAYIENYRVGGKTGTAQKVVDGKYTVDCTDVISKFGNVCKRWQ